MAETVVCFVLDKLVPLITAKAGMLSGLPTELVAIGNELRSIKVFLKDAELRAEENDGVKEWVRQVRDIAYQIEDVIDEHLLLQYPHDHPYHQCFNIFSYLTRCVFLLRPKHQIASTIRRVRSEVLEINQRRSSFTLGGGPSSSNGLEYEDPHKHIDQDPRAGFLYVDESELVGIDDPKRDLIRMLDLEPQDFPQGKLISVIGMGGLGKTTVVRKLYEDMYVRKHFPLRAWITLSQPNKTIHVIRNMLTLFYRSARDCVPPEIGNMDEESLIEVLRNYLRERRFLVVFDDVWSIETYIKDVLPTNNNGNRILMTTRLEDVALAWKGSSFDHVYKLQPLSSEKAWDLFCRKAFRDLKANCPLELENLSRAIVRKCEGLPLAIVTIGGLLSTKNKIVMEWQNLCNSIGAELASNLHLASLKKILLLSYHDLPHYLKPCFLYMGIFPGDHSIELHRLVRLWMAEGFIPRKSGKTLEAVANEFLIELIRRSLVHVTWVDVSGRPRNIRVHDLLREIILLKSHELSFFRVLNEENSSMDAQSRRLVIQNDKQGTSTEVVVEGMARKQGVRSLFLFLEHEAVPKFMTGSFLRAVHLLKVLDLQNAPVNYIPEATGSLRHLQYLSLKWTKVEKLPRSIGKLGNLQSMDLKHSLIQELPAEIEMQNLGWVDVSHSAGFIDQLGNLKQLRRLGVAQLTREDGRNLCNAIKNMHHLEEFMIASRNKDEVLEIDRMSSPPMLRRLLLMGRLDKLPEWISMLENVVKLVLCHSSLNHDPLEVIGALPNLIKLIVCEAYDGEQLHISARRFQKLKVLRLYNLCNLKSLKILLGALPVLEELELGPSPLLKEVPISIKNLENLTLLRFHDMPKEFLDDLTPKTGQHYHIIDHVPNVYINFMAGAAHWETSLRHPQYKEMVSYKTGAMYQRCKRSSAWGTTGAPIYKPSGGTGK
ncbi:disease resistance protein RPM1-like isoform X2 [Chenopodium quinoa]|uniref:disease resistance protein RPM1-like isoform X2 n=1 Tax=Chenopodium quinoa TaxID=63459 RepID=UPI000B785B84|nr:disease resistance protein RPM1-like isoform X2 [Chenopodium quinoa]